jgi:hypothetical protein
MLLEDEQVEKLITKISVGVTIEIIDGQLITFKFPSNLIKLEADVLYEDEYQKAIDSGLLNRSSLEELIKKRNLFTDEDQKKLEGLKTKLEGQRVLLAKTTVVKANQSRIKGVMAKLRSDINQLTGQKTSKLMMSAEVKANEEKSLFLCWRCVFNTDKLLWETFKEFKHTSDIKFRDTVLTSFLVFYSGLPAAEIRFIARHNLWRIRYVNSQKLAEALFGIPSVDYTNDMLSLAYWSNYYDNIYQMMSEDKPSDLIIEDDEALDAYMKSFYEERTREDAAKRSKSKSPGKLSAFDSEEVIVTASNELYRDIEYDTPREAKKLKERNEVKKRTKRRG